MQKSDDWTYLRAWGAECRDQSGWQRQQREQIGPKGWVKGTVHVHTYILKKTEVSGGVYTRSDKHDLTLPGCRRKQTQANGDKQLVKTSRVILYS